MKPLVFIAIGLAFGLAFGWLFTKHFNPCPEPLPQDPRIAATLDSLKADGLRKDTLINALLDAEPVTIRIREQIPLSRAMGLDSLYRDLLADPE